MAPGFHSGEALAPQWGRYTLMGTEGLGAGEPRMPSSEDPWAQVSQGGNQLIQCPSLMMCKTEQFNALRVLP